MLYKPHPAGLMNSTEIGDREQITISQLCKRTSQCLLVSLLPVSVTAGQVTVTQGQAAKSLVVFGPIGFEINVDGKAQAVWSHMLSNFWRTGEREKEKRKKKREREEKKRVSNVLKLISRKKKKKKEKND